MIKIRSPVIACLVAVKASKGEKFCYENQKIMPVTLLARRPEYSGLTRVHI